MESQARFIGQENTNAFFNPGINHQSDGQGKVEPSVLKKLRKSILNIFPKNSQN